MDGWMESQTGSIGFESSEYLAGREGIMKDVIEQHYGICRIHRWSLTHTRDKSQDLLTVIYTICLLWVPQLYGSTKYYIAGLPL